MQIRPYQGDKAQWNEFVANSRNGTFLFDRNYMDYHADRFDDASLMFYDNDQLQAVLPASKQDDSLVSHGGLTFGGLVLSQKSGAAFVKAAFEALAEKLSEEGFAKLVYKPVPHIYHKAPSEEDLYVLYQMGATTSRIDLSTTINQAKPGKLAKGRKHALSKARKAGVTIKQSSDYAMFWQILEANLKDKHDTNPTHSLLEMMQLAEAFEEIQLYLAYLGELPVAGVVVYDYGNVAHTQYIASTDESRESGALDALIVELFQNIYKEHAYFNFGISTCQNGQYFNAGLAAQKEMFGGRTTTLQWMELTL